jgi:hypothetical protein
MRKKMPLQIAIFFLLFLFTIAGKSIESTTNLLSPTRPSDRQSQESMQEHIVQNAVVSKLSEKTKDSTQLTGEIVGRDGNTLAIKQNDTITRATLPSNATVSKNGVDVPRSSVRTNDYVYATLSDRHTIMSMTSFSKPILDLLSIALILSVLLSAYFLTLFLLRYLTSALYGNQKTRQHVAL